MKVCFFDRAALEQRLKMADVLDVVEGVYKSKAEGKTVVWPTVTHNFEDRGAVMDIRSGYDRGSEVYGAKLLATFPGNDKLGLPRSAVSSSQWTVQRPSQGHHGRLVHHLDAHRRGGSGQRPRAGPSGI